MRGFLPVSESRIPAIFSFLLIWRVQNGSFGYAGGDFDLNGAVNAVDQNLYWRVNNGTFSQVP